MNKRVQLRERVFHGSPLLEGEPVAWLVRPSGVREVVSFPIKAADEAIIAKDVNAVEQIEWQNWLQTYWSDNSVSVTVYYRQEELPAIQKWLSENYDKKVKSISFLLHSGHGFKQAPYEEISEDQYKEMVADARPINRVDDDQVRGFAESLECASGSCPVK